MTQQVYKSRDQATEFVRSRGVPIGDRQLADLAQRNRGPRYSIVNGRALYTEPDLLTWLDMEAQQPPSACRRGRGKSTAATAAA
jgi:hypothetical protein